MDGSLIVDGLLSETGVRDEFEGDYYDLEGLGVSAELRDRIEKWLEGYARATYRSFRDGSVNEELDKEGLEITRQLAEELKTFRVRYYSNALLKYIGPVYRPK